MAEFSTEYVKVSEPSPHVLLVELNRVPLNAFSNEFWAQYASVLDSISEQAKDVRAVVLASAIPKIFTAGIDFKALTDMDNWGTEAARRAYFSRKYITEFQKAIQAPERCPFPVIAAVHGPVIGLGIDIISACDIRYASTDATFAIKEVDIGLAADIGTLSHLTKITSNHSLARELAYTGRFFSAADAEKLGLVSKIIEGRRDGVVKEALELAKVIATKSPVAVAGTKRLVLHSRDHSVAENLEYTAVWNAAMIQTDDIKKAAYASAMKSKEPPQFDPLQKQKQKPSSKL